MKLCGKILLLTSVLVTSIANFDVSTASFYLWYQPRIPKAIR